jgi:hypothetical protein
MARTYFPKVKEAREALAERAVEILESYIAVASAAMASQKPEVAAEVYRWLLDHMPRSVEGSSVIDSSAAKPKELDSGPKAPAIQIGIALGGMPQPPKELPPVEVVEVKHED